MSPLTQQPHEPWSLKEAVVQGRWLGKGQAWGLQLVRHLIAIVYVVRRSLGRSSCLALK